MTLQLYSLPRVNGPSIGVTEGLFGHTLGTSTQHVIRQPTEKVRLAGSIFRQKEEVTT